MYTQLSEALRQVSYNVSAVTIVLRFIIGVILAGGFALWAQMEFAIAAVFTVGVAVMAAIWGDKLILGFMSLMRYFR